MLQLLDLNPVYDSENYDLIRDLQVPLLSNSKDYLRGVGFFTSGWLKLASQGMANLIRSGGRARIVLSPILEAEDWNALQMGDAAKKDKLLYEILSRNMFDIENTLEKDTRNALAWMVADGFLEFRFALPRNRMSIGDYHDKVAIFCDKNNNRVAIHGSLNDSIKASLNGEAFSVFKSWEPGQLPYVEMHQSRLESLWNNDNKQFTVFCIPDAVKEKLISLRTSAAPPYKVIESKNTFDLQPQFECPFTLYPYQEKAIKEWRKADCRGIFEMATGTGKTITSLAAAASVYKDTGRLALIILVPYLHMLDQWERNCRDFGLNPILCSGEHGRWQIDVKTAIQDYKIKVKSNICILAVHRTASMDRFIKAIQGLPEINTMCIGDEAHGFGASNLRNALFENSQLRLGLSATPRRWFDDEGTNIIYGYFGPTCFEFTLDEAIGKFLTPYEYHPQLISLSNEELEEYETITRAINKLRTPDDDPQKNEAIKRLLLKRSRIVSSAEQKLPSLLELIRSMNKEHKLKGKELGGVLIYCAPGEHKQVLQAVSRIGLRCHEFVHDVKLKDREQLLNQFSKGEIQVLVAIKCLDEGVDIPSTRIAFILASSTNPREFVQRRGRILRKSEGKSLASIFDYIVVPSQDRLKYKFDSDLSILQREFPRFAEFSSSAVNQFEARSKVRDILDKFGMLHLLDDKPWSSYHALKTWDWSL